MSDLLDTVAKALNIGMSKRRMVEELRNLRVDNSRLRSDLDRIMGIGSGIIYIIDPEGKFTFLNRAVEEILHYDTGELLGKHFSLLLPEGEYERVGRAFVLPKFHGKATGPENAPKLFDERRTRGRKTRNLEIQLLTKEKREVKVFLGDVTGIISSEGAYEPDADARNREAAFLGSQGIIYDITKYKELEREKQELQEHVAEMQRIESIGRFAGTMAHDLNNKLGAIMAFADIVKKKYAPGNHELSSYVEAILSSSRHAAELSSRLLTFAAEGRFRTVEMDLNTAVHKVMKLLRHSIGAQVQMRQFLHAEAALMRGDPTEIQDAILTLATTSAESMDHASDLVFATKIVTLDKEFLQSHSIVGATGPYIMLTIICSCGSAERPRRAESAQIAIRQSAERKLDDVHLCARRHKGFIESLCESGKSRRWDVYFPYVESPKGPN